MSLISIQISSGATVHLPWNIIGGYEKDCTIAELYSGIKSGAICIDFWSFPDKLSNYDVGASIGRSKVDTFDRISVNTSISEAISTFGRYIKLELHKPDSKDSIASSCTSSTSSNESKSMNAFEVLKQASRKLSLPEQYPEDTKSAN